MKCDEAGGALCACGLALIYRGLNGPNAASFVDDGGGWWFRSWKCVRRKRCALDKRDKNDDCLKEFWFNAQCKIGLNAECV